VTMLNDVCNTNSSGLSYLSSSRLTVYLYYAFQVDGLLSLFMFSRKDVYFYNSSTLKVQHLELIYTQSY